MLWYLGKNCMPKYQMSGTSSDILTSLPVCTRSDVAGLGFCLLSKVLPANQLIIGRGLAVLPSKGFFISSAEVHCSILALHRRERRSQGKVGSLVQWENLGKIAAESVHMRNLNLFLPFHAFLTQTPTACMH